MICPPWSSTRPGYALPRPALGAWSWAEAVAYYRLARDVDADSDVERFLNTSEQQLSDVTADLAGKESLLRCLERITERQRQALQSYKLQMARYGRGQSRHRDYHLAAIRDAMREAQGAVPAWIMPLTAVADTLPAQADSFDVVIVDEASQAGIESLYLLWMAPRIIVVGDDKQCAPGPKYRLDEARHLVDEHLPDVDLHVRNGLSPASNLYEVLSAHVPKVIRLSEHFRCMPEIIRWSSEQFYDNRLVPLRQFGADRLDPLKVVTVHDAETSGSGSSLSNRAEAEAIIAHIRDMIDDPAYQDRSIGIISRHRCSQAKLLQRLRSGTVVSAGGW